MSAGPLRARICPPALSWDAIRNEPDVHENVAEAGEQVELSLAALIGAAVAPLETTPADRAVVRAMIDLNTWEALRDQELGQAEAVTAIAEMLIGRLSEPDGLEGDRLADGSALCKAVDPSLISSSSGTCTTRHHTSAYSLAPSHATVYSRCHLACEGGP